MKIYCKLCGTLLGEVSYILHPDKVICFCNTDHYQEWKARQEPPKSTFVNGLREGG